VFDTIQLTTTCGKAIEITDEVIGSGAMKDVYKSTCGEYVVAFYRGALSASGRDRIDQIVGKYATNIFDGLGGDYFKGLFCWPEGVVEHQGKVGLVMPLYRSNFFFDYGSQNGDQLGIGGKEKEGKWFASANLRNRHLDKRELGDWSSYLRVCLLIARAVRRLHSEGLAHGDLSYKNVLIDPLSGRPCIVDVDGLVVPGKYQADVVGTPDFIAPEVIMTQHLEKERRVLPTIETDQHAMAVLFYMLLFYRHPLRGKKIHDPNDSERDEAMAMGEAALFIEHSEDTSNRIDCEEARSTELPWFDTEKIPYSIAGPYIQPLFDRAFVNGLHNPLMRPIASEWETALSKTLDLIQPCQNPECEQKWFVFDNSQKPCCPFCGTEYKGQLPILNVYNRFGSTAFRPVNHRIMVWSGQSLYWWHANSRYVPNEKIESEKKKRVGYFAFHENSWWLVNEGLPNMLNADTKQAIPVGSKVQLTEGAKLLFDNSETGQLALVQLVNN
jgi:serine/threonine protein kinase